MSFPSNPDDVTIVAEIQEWPPKKLATYLNSQSRANRFDTVGKWKAHCASDDCMFCVAVLARLNALAFPMSDASENIYETVSRLTAFNPSN